jgi:hypothetical protein
VVFEILSRTSTSRKPDNRSALPAVFVGAENSLTGGRNAVYQCATTMTPSDPTPRLSRAESMFAFSIMSFAVALLCFMLGWAYGVHRGRALLHFPTSVGWLLTTAILTGLGVILMVWSRGAKRG